MLSLRLRIVAVVLLSSCAKFERVDVWPADDSLPNIDNWGWVRIGSTVLVEQTQRDARALSPVPLVASIRRVKDGTISFHSSLPRQVSAYVLAGVAEDSLWTLGTYPDTNDLTYHLFHYDGSSWSDVATLPADVFSVYGLGTVTRDAVWIVGAREIMDEHPYVARWNGTALVEPRSPQLDAHGSNARLNRMVVVSDEELFFARTDQVVRWTPSKAEVILFDEQVRSLQRVGEKIFIAHGVVAEMWNGSAFEVKYTRQALGGVTWAGGLSPDDLWLVEEGVPGSFKREEATSVTRLRGSERILYPYMWDRGSMNDNEFFAPVADRVYAWDNFELVALKF